MERSRCLEHLPMTRSASVSLVPWDSHWITALRSRRKRTHPEPTGEQMAPARQKWSATRGWSQGIAATSIVQIIDIYTNLQSVTVRGTAPRQMPMRWPSSPYLPLTALHRRTARATLLATHNPRSSTRPGSMRESEAVLSRAWNASLERFGIAGSFDSATSPGLHLATICTR